MILRLGVTSLIVTLVTVAFLGFATGDLVRHAWDKHPRHAGTQQASPPHVAWKTTPGVAPPVVALAALPLAGAVVTLAILGLDGAPPRAPFVPPRG